jgi:predicted secreted protein
VAFGTNGRAVRLYSGQAADEAEPDLDSMAEPIEVTVGEAFDVSLEALGPAGYTWRPDAAEPVGRVDYLGDSWGQLPRNRVGGPGLQVFHFRAVAPGQATIRFSYGRSWEREPAASREVSVLIREAASGGQAEL